APSPIARCSRSSASGASAPGGALAARSAVVWLLVWRIAPRIAALGFPPMALAEHFQEIIDALPEDWTDLELDMRIADEARYVETALYLATCNARPYSHHDWHWRLLVAHRFGHAAAAPTVHGALRLIDNAGIEGELVVRELRSGRVEVTQM